MLNHRRGFIASCALLFVAAAAAFAQQPQGSIAFTVSMDDPAAQLYHVVMRCDGITSPALDFKMPVWSPGYYGIFDFAANVQNFRAQDGAGRALPWEKAAANDWRVRSDNAATVTITYDVLADSTFAANSYLHESRGLIVGTSVFLHVAGLVRHPATVEIELYPEWKTIATGLDPVSPDRPNVLAAPDFDVLYDSPILMGNLDALPEFDIQGVPHQFIGYQLGDNFDHALFMRNLKTVLEQGIAVIGEIPYTRYVFLGIGSGAGGIEHLNSTVVPFTGNPNYDTPDGLARTMSFLAHEYFHHYNVKRIRPIALGPFDYDRENRTNMLWVSEGWTVYYQYLMLARAGLMTQDELLQSLQRNIASYENTTGHLFQSATQASWTSWSQGPFGGGGRGTRATAAGRRGRAGDGRRAGAATATERGARRASGARRGPGARGGAISKTISYYAKGPILGMLLDFKIRHETQNQKSLDDLMRALYQKYYKDLKRGWTDEEFQQECEKIAGVSLQENFDYASTTIDIDYDKYLGYAGLKLEPPAELPDTRLGAIVEDADGQLTVAAVDGDSPAARAAFKPGDVIRSLDGSTVDAAALNAAIAARKPGDTVTIALARDGQIRQMEVALDHRIERGFRIVPIPNPDPLQSDILKSWQAKK